jgi:hypothetical protein
MQLDSTLDPSRMVAHIFDNWLNEVDHSFKILIMVEVIAVIWWL